MVAKTRRKIIIIGIKKYQSQAVTLPPDWIRYNQPKKVDIYYDTLIVVTLPEQPNRLEDRVKDFLPMIS